MVNVESLLPVKASQAAPLNRAWVVSAVEFAILLLGLAAAFLGAVQSMAATWLTSSAYHHGIIVAPVATWLILRRRDWRYADPSRDWRGALVIGGATLLFLAGNAANVALVEQASFVLAVIGAVILCFGADLSRRWAFPLVFLFFMVPFGVEATPALQDLTSRVVACLLNLSGVATIRDGFILSTATGRFEIAESCSGLRFLLASAMISILFASTSFTRWSSRAAFIAAAIIGALIANWLRAYAVIVIATLSNRQFGVGADHVALGWAIYALLIVGLALFARPYVVSETSARAAKRQRTPGASVHVTLATMTVLSVIIVFNAADAKRADIAISPNAVITPSADGFALSQPDTRWTPHVPNADALQSTVETSSDTTLTIGAAYFHYDRAGAEIAGSDVRAADGLVWRRIAVTREGFSVAGEPKTLMIETITNASGEKRSVASLYWLADRYYANPAALKFAAARARLAGKAPQGGALFISSDAASETERRRAIETYLARLSPVADWRPRDPKEN